MIETLSTIYVLGVPFVLPVLALMGYRDFIGSCPNLAALAHERRDAAGYAVLFGVLFSLFWPVGLPAMYCMTGFAQFGILRQKYRDEDARVQEQQS